MEISEALAAAYQDETRREDRASCPGSEELTAFAAGELPDEGRDAVADHLVACADCSLEVRLAREAREFFFADNASAEGAAEEVLAELEEPLASPLPMAARPGRPRRRVPAIFAVAASLVLALGLAWQLGPGASGPDDVERSVPRAGELVPHEGAVLDVAPGRLAWPPEVGAEAYRIEILDSGARSIWSGPWADEPAAELPSEIVSELVAGDYLWRVEVRGPVARSELGPFVFTLR